MTSPDLKKHAMYVAYLSCMPVDPKRPDKELKNLRDYFDWAKRPQITRLMKKAREEGYLPLLPEFQSERCSPEDKAELEKLDLSRMLRENLRKAAMDAGVRKGVALRGIRILPSGGLGHTPAEMDERLEYFSSCVARELIARIAQSTLFGVTWGKTLASAVEAIARLGPKPLKSGARRFFATCGEFSSTEPLEASSSHIAESLNALQGGKGAGVRTLRGIPAFIPPGPNRNEIRRFIRGHTAFGNIFGKELKDRPSSDIGRSDTVLTSVGMFEKPLSKFVKELIKKSGCPLDHLKHLAYGDIGGVLIKKSRLRKAAAETFAGIAATWIGVSEKDLKGVVARSARKQKPGVVVLAIGANKAEIVYEVVSRGLVSELFVDQELAAELVDYCGVKFPDLPKDDRRKCVMYVACLVSQGFRPKKIAEYFEGATESQINRLEEKAREKGYKYLPDVEKFNFMKCKPGERAELENLDLSIRLCNQLHAMAKADRPGSSETLRGIRILPSGGFGHTPAEVDERLKCFSSCVAPELLARIARSKVVGVTWGKMLANAVGAVAMLDLKPLRNGKRRFIAICGEPFSMEALEASSSHIAESLNALQGGRDAEVSTLRGIPAFIPSGFKRDKILPFIHEHTAFGRIFGERPEDRHKGAISKLDTVITSVGTFEDPPGAFVFELMNKSGCSLAELKELAHGNIGGVLIKRSKLAPAADEKFERIAATWIGVSEEDLKNVVASSASKRKKKPGVVVLAIGANKAEIVRAVVSRGLVSELFVDQELATKLAELCGLDPKPEVRAP